MRHQQIRVAFCQVDSITAVRHLVRGFPQSKTQVSRFFHYKSKLCLQKLTVLLPWPNTNLLHYFSCCLPLAVPVFLPHFFNSAFHLHRCMGGTPRSWVCMPRRKLPACGMEEEECGMEKDCGGPPVFAVVLQISWIMRKTPVLSASVSDAHVTTPHL